MWSLQFCVLNCFLVYSFILQGPQGWIAAAPVGQENNKVTFHVYSGDNGDESSEATPDNIAPNYPLTLVLHGFSGSYTTKSVRMIRDGLLYRGNKNVILVDWESLAKIENVTVTVSYYQIVEENVPLVANEITSWLKSLRNKNLINYSEVHIIGFSLGAQIAGLVGSQLEGEIGRITALDPPKIGFADKTLSEKLDRSDAQFVFVMHTSSGFISFAEPIGHVDFYPNGGLPPQPECPKDDLIHSMACSHYMAYKLYTETMYNDAAFNATKCKDWFTYLAGHCKNNENALMGYPTTNVTEGSFYIKTNTRPPFGNTPEGAIPNNILALMEYSEEDKEQISSSFLDNDTGDVDEKDVYDVPQTTEPTTDESSKDEGPGHSIMKVKSKPNNGSSTTVRTFVIDKNAADRNYQSHILILFSCLLSLRYFRL